AGSALRGAHPSPRLRKSGRRGRRSRRSRTRRQVMNRPRPGLDRRQFLRQLAAAGLLTVPGAGVLSACATSGGGPTTSAQGEVSAQNPLGVAPDAPLDVVIFKG